MARYRFQAINSDGATLDGDLVAESERDAARQLEKRGLSVVSLQAAAAATSSGRRQRRLRQRDIILALHELSTLLESGVGLAEAVAAQTRSAHHPRLLMAFEGVSVALRQGQPFSQALGGTGLPLPDYVDTLVRSGEKAGMLGRALRDAVAQMEYDQTVRGEIRSALTYPAILVLAGLGAVVMMFTFVVPKFAGLLQRAEDLPLLAAVVLNTGMFAHQYWWLVLGVVAVAMTWLGLALRKPEARARGYERLERLPVVGTWRVEAETARWARILAILLINKVPLLDALALAQAGVNAPGRRLRLEEAARGVRGGTTLADSLEQQDTLTATGYNLIRVGERSGELPAMLLSLARLCEESGRGRMKQFLALLEPAAILVIGSMIGLIMIGIILAITSANDIAI